MFAKRRTFEAQWLALLAHALLASTERTEVVCGLRNDWIGGLVSFGALNGRKRVGGIIGTIVELRGRRH